MARKCGERLMRVRLNHERRAMRIYTTELLSNRPQQSAVAWPTRNGLHFLTRLAWISATLFGLSGVAAFVDAAPFDLPGPTLEARVTRAGEALPISKVPNLEVGDLLWMRADLPPTQSARYLMVVAFLRGSTNPPPKSWFVRCETWTPRCAKDGLIVSVPEGAQQVLVLLAPETGGDFKTLMNAVRGRPGAFVRTSQDLNQASLDRARLQRYLSAVRALSDDDPSMLKEVAPLLARSLAIKVDARCLDRIPALQAPCLMQDQDSLILNDGHSTSIVQALTAGPANDLAMEASYTPQLSYGYYSPYIASVLDIARIFDSFETARYQYIPALASLQDDRLLLTLNAPPSFHDPMSVLVTALPAIETPQLPPLHAVNSKESFCASSTSLILPVEGAPLVFSTDYAHDMTLRLRDERGGTLELPARADAERGGFVIGTLGAASAELGAIIQGSLRGRWGFENYQGPTFRLLNPGAQDWQLAPSDVVVGRENTLHLSTANVACIQRITVTTVAGEELKSQWKISAPGDLVVTLPLEGVPPGSLNLLVTPYGGYQPQAVQLHAFSEAAHIDSFTIHAGDRQGILKGSRLDEVASLLVRDVPFTPATLTSSLGHDELTVVTEDPRAITSLKEGDLASIRITLKDGRVFTTRTPIAAPRPKVTLIGKSVLVDASKDSAIRVTNPNEIPQNGKLTFSVRAASPARFLRDEIIEVATSDGAFSSLLSTLNGGLMLEDPQVGVATFDPVAAFGGSAFGPLQFRAIAGGVAGDWQPLATLVRLPVLKDVTCPATPDLACKLTGARLFLLGAVSDDPSFAHAVQVPDGFPGSALPVPHPATVGRLYVKLRDDPSVINPAFLEEQQLAPSPEELARAAARQEARSIEHDSAAASDSSHAPTSPPPVDSLAQPAPPSAGTAPSSLPVVAPVPENADHSQPPARTSPHAADQALAARPTGTT
jgi:hypothetical protein